MEDDELRKDNQVVEEEQEENGQEQEQAICVPAIVRPKKVQKGKSHLVAIGVASLCFGVGLGAGLSCFSTVGRNSQREITADDLWQTPAGSKTPITYTDASDMDGVVVNIAKSIGPCIVSVYNNKKVSASDLAAYYAGASGEVVTGLGSGIIFKEDSTFYYIVTNSHVVEGADSLAVNFLGDTKAAGTLVGKDSLNDIAVIKVSKEVIDETVKATIRIAPFGDSNSLEVGQLAIAIGTPATDALNNTVTRGIISAVERTILVGGNKMKLVQTDAAINPGNSGGALVGPTGEIIGINVAKSVTSEGIGFAIPINTVKPIIVELMNHGSVIRPGLGIMGTEVANGNVYDLPIGIYISEVMKGGSADLAGIKVGDILISFNGETITTMDQLKARIAQKHVGDIVEVKLIRNNMQKTLKLELRQMPD